MTGSLTVDDSDPTPPYEQLRRQLAELIAHGVLAPGDRLPPVRQLAGDLGLAAGTVARTYRELEAAALIRSRRGGGTRVADRPAHLSESERRSQLDDEARAFVATARRLGFDHDQITGSVGRALSLDVRGARGPDPQKGGGSGSVV